MIKIPKINDYVIRAYQDEIVINPPSAIKSSILMKSYLKFSNDFKLFNSILVEEIFSQSLDQDLYSFINEYIEITKFVNIKKSATVSSTFEMFGITASDYKTKYNLLQNKINSYLNPRLAKIGTITNQKDLNNEVSLLKIKYKPMNDFFVSMYDYKVFSTKKELKNYFLHSLNVQVCPYCNRNFISSYKKDGSYKTTAAIDHFYPQEEFPLFSLSLYNYIPSCFACNSIFKKEKVGFLYPYERGFDSDARFELEFNNTKEEKEFYFGHKNVNFKIKIKENEFSPNRKKIHYNIEKFDLNELYSSDDFVNYSFVKNLYDRYKYSNDESVKNILKNKIYRDEKISDKKMEEVILGYSFDDFEATQKPFAKLAKDILKK